MKKVKVIFEQCYKGSQSWQFERIVEVAGNKYRIYIKRDAYDSQSKASAEYWNGKEWSQVVSKHISVCACKEISYVHDNVKPAAFQEDFESLIKIAVALVE